MIAAALDLDAVLADRVPADKVDAVAAEQRLHPTLMVGDGINDARGASASSEAADVVILVDRLDRVSDAVGIARRTRGIAMQSIAVGLGLSGIAMLAAAFGWLTPVAGALTRKPSTSPSSSTPCARSCRAGVLARRAWRRRRRGR